jgi:hypothetical protein
MEFLQKSGVVPTCLVPSRSPPFPACSSCPPAPSAPPAPPYTFSTNILWFPGSKKNEEGKYFGKSLATCANQCITDFSSPVISIAAPSLQRISEGTKTEKGQRESVAQNVKSGTKLVQKLVQNRYKTVQNQNKIGTRLIQNWVNLVT